MFKRRHPARGSQSLINLDDGRAISGVITDESGEHLIVNSAKLFEPETPQGTELEGTVIVPVAKVSWIEVK